MSEDTLRTRQNCCRLCLAPDNECISILNSYAADKEPLTTKILNCVSIKITPNDRFSLRICHACISYLNSWQSFKNRCIASQCKQRNWLDTEKQRQQLLDNNVSISTISNSTGGAGSSSIPQPADDYQDQSALASSILDGITSLKKRKSLTVYVSPKTQQQQPPQNQSFQLKSKQQQQQQHAQKASSKHLHAACINQQSTTQTHRTKPAAKYKQRSKELEKKCEKSLLPQEQQQPLKQQSQQQQQQLQQQQTLAQQTTEQSQPSEQLSQQQFVAATSFQSAAQQLRLFRRYSYNPLPAVQIKDEPLDIDDDYNAKQHDESDEMVDPTLFLERTEEEGDEPLLEATGYEYHNERNAIATVAAAVAEVKEASCRACNLKFSTRANARRHERNLHPNLFELSTATPNNMPITKPTAALAAALELQRTLAAADAAKMSSLISPQKYRQEVVNAFNKCESGGYDYENPEKYQHLLTDEKIVFLQQNEEFLQQYQSMTCRCCKKFYSTYKNFMAHMRKKYATLPRNLCFNCLKLNDSKALFISHLKRRNCINLYKVLHALMAKNANFAAAVTATAAAAPEKLRAKELLVNKMYECKLCPKHFRLKLEFRSHVYEEHGDVQRKEAAPTQCSFCGLEIEDPAERKRHYNNMDCLVMLRCVTCDEKFDNHQKFLDHVYEKHLAGFGEQLQPQLQQQFQQQRFGSADEIRTHPPSGSGGQPQKSQYFSRMPQACPICGQQYNNYNNVLRHMESKHPDQLPQTYKCVKCGIGYPRLSNLREHMVSAHAADKARHTGFEYIVNADAVKSAGGDSNNTYGGRYDYVMKDLMSITNGGNGAEDDDDANESVSKKMRMDNAVSSTSGGAASGANNNAHSTLKECPICSAVFSNNIGLSNHMRSHTAAAQGAAQAAVRGTPSSLTITATGGSNGNNALQQQQTPTQQAVFKRNLEQAADRRFRRMRCRICQRRFSSKKSYRFHMLNDHQIRNVQFIKCKLCDAEFAYEKGLKVHMFKIHNTLLKDEMIIKQYECDICSIVYRTEEQLLQHKKNIHGDEEANFNDTLGADTSSAGADLSGISTPISSAVGNSSVGERSLLDSSTATPGTAAGPLYWYQCKYCPSNFNTNKKLAIHINSHDEFDSNDYSCKDCGNVYSGRKSLWVHRYKKHPQIAEPSECTLCKKVFFDSQMLENHIPTCNRKPITATGATAEAANMPIYKHKTGDDDDDYSRDADEDAVGISAGTLGGGEVEITAIPRNMKIKIPEVACTICGQRFTDQELFARHIQMHEMELYTDNPLAAMFDTGPADPNQFYLDRVNDNGEYACDLCQKTFTQMTALKVHRKWHFRGDSKQNLAEAEHTTNAATLPQMRPNNLQHLQGLQAVGLMPRPASKSQKRKRELKCEYCPSTFISNNNLRRHIYELHKDEVGNLPEPPKIEIDDYLNCRRCNVKFETKQEWIEHKVSDARVMKPFGPFQWGCDLCGLYVSRKEKLINHIHNHMKEAVITPIEQQETKPKIIAQQQQQERQQLQKQANKLDVADELLTKTKHGNKKQQLANDLGGDSGVLKEEYEDEAVDDEVEDEEQENADEEADGDYEEADEEVDDEAAEADEYVGMDEDEDDVEDTNDDDTNDGIKRRLVVTTVRSNSNSKTPTMPHIKIKAIRNSADTTEAEDSPSYVGDDDEDDNEEEEDDVEEDAEEDDDDDANAAADVEGNDESERDEHNAEADDDDEDDDDDADDDDDEQSSSSEEAEVKPPATKSRFACDLCQVYFETQQELQKHVKMHFLNGPGSVTLTEIKPKSINKSRSSSSDVVAVSSS